MANLEVVAEVAEFKQQLHAQRDQMPESHATRLHRACSWWRAAVEHEEQLDIQFMSLSIALRSCCLNASNAADSTPDLLPLIRNLVELDNEKRIYHLLWHKYSGPVKALIKNQFIFQPFWDAMRGADLDWEAEFAQHSVAALNHLSRQQVPELLGILLQRLAVLERQLSHGGATYESQVNRAQIGDAVAILLELIPVFLTIMLNNPMQNWGELAYPVINPI